MWYWRGKLPEPVAEEKNIYLGRDKYAKDFVKVGKRLVWFNSRGTPSFAIEPEAANKVCVWNYSYETDTFLRAHCEWAEWMYAKKRTNRQWLKNLDDRLLAEFLASAEARTASEWLRWLKEEHRK